MNTRHRQILVTILILLCCTTTVTESLLESDRMDEYRRRGHQWPPKDDEFTPNTPGWRKIFKRRFEQLRSVKDHVYDGYMITSHSALNCKNFTENGWGLTRAPQHIMDLLLESLHDGLEKQKINPIYEPRTSVIETDLPPLFIPQNELNDYIVNALLPHHEAWSGVKLFPNNAYGLRIYRDGSNLNMHVDKSETHIISSILHVDHDGNDEPWPIVIEDFQGNTNEVFLESGDMLFYESSKCLHGRPKKMKGGWYSSLFIHYHPVDWDPEKVAMDNHYRIPGDWNQYRPMRARSLENLAVVESSLKEPGCKDDWCALENAVMTFGPAPGYGKVLSAGGIITELENIPTEDSFEHHEDYDL